MAAKASRLFSIVAASIRSANSVAGPSLNQITLKSCSESSEPIARISSRCSRLNVSAIDPLRSIT